MIRESDQLNTDHHSLVEMRTATGTVVSVYDQVVAANASPHISTANNLLIGTG